jgi:hypothetical protein
LSTGSSTWTRSALWNLKPMCSSNIPVSTHLHERLAYLMDHSCNRSRLQ